MLSSFPSGAAPISGAAPFTLLKFESPTCAPCKALKEPLASILTQRPVFLYTAVDITLDPEMASLHGIRSVPTVVVFQGEKEVFRLTGDQRIRLELAGQLDALLTNNDPNEF